MGLLKDLFNSSSGEVINTVGSTLDKAITTPGDKMQLQLEIDKAAQQFEMEMKNFSLEEKKTMLGDVDGARKRETEMQTNPNTTHLGKNISSYLAIGGSALCFTLFAWLMFGQWNPTDTSKKEIVLYVLGVLSGLLTQIYSYYFGSSQGSAAKTDIINTMHQNTVSK